jgi:sugar (pentulose or hexulose) kinase
MCFGFQNGNKVDAITKSGTGVRLEYLKPADELLMCAIQFADTKDETSLLDQEQRYELAERYAEGGIRLLKNMMDDPGNFIQDLSSHVVPLLKNFKA